MCITIGMPIGIPCHCMHYVNTCVVVFFFFYVFSSLHSVHLFRRLVRPLMRGLIRDLRSEVSTYWFGMLCNMRKYYSMPLYTHAGIL